MGGLGSGPWGTARYYTVEESCVLDTAWFKQRGVLKAGVIAPGSCMWTRGNEKAASIGWWVDTTELGREYIRVYYSVRHNPEQAWARIEERVQLASSRPNYGGLRWWFVCPCSRRCAKLYLPPAGRHFRCRMCYRLAYACQRETVSDRLLRRADKLRRRHSLGDRGTVPLRPTGMRRATYYRLADEIETLEYRALATAFARLFPTHAISAKLRA